MMWIFKWKAVTKTNREDEMKTESHPNKKDSKNPGGEI